MSLVNEALALAERGLYVFPVNARTKRPVWSASDSPNGRGGHLAATRDPAEIAALFTRGGAVGVFLRKSGLIAFDVDYRDGAEEANSKLLGWVSEYLTEDGCRVHISQNGGEHWIYSYPEDGERPPGAIFPELQVKWDGYIVWPTEGSKYTVDLDTAIEDLGQPPAGAFEVQEAKRGVKSDGGIMSREDAIAVLEGDEEGQRHEAVNALAIYEVREAPFDSLEELVERVCDSIREHMPASARKDDLLDITYDPDSEVVRAVRPLMPGGRLRTKAVGSRGIDMLEAVASISRGDDEPIIQPIIQREQQASAELPAGFKLFSSYDDGEELSLAPWVIEDILREGDIGAVIGAPNVGKTNVTALWIAALISGDGSIAGLGIPQAVNVAWINPEEDRDALKLRLRAAIQEHAVERLCEAYIAGDELLSIDGDYASLVVPGEDGRAIVNEALVEAYIRDLVEADVDILMLDPITEFNGGDENSRGDTRLLFRAMMMLAQEAGLSVIYWGHTGKPAKGERPDWYRGDIHAQRGSSGASGSIKMGATLTPFIPSGKTSEEAHYYRRMAVDNDDPTPNTVEFVVTKAKMASRRPNLFYTIAPSSLDREVPVARLVEPAVAQDAGVAALSRAYDKQVEPIAEVLKAAFRAERNDVTLGQIARELDRAVQNGALAEGLWKVRTGSVRRREGAGKQLLQLFEEGRCGVRIIDDETSNTTVLVIDQEA